MKKPMKKAYLILLAMAVAFGARAEVDCSFESGVIDSAWVIPEDAQTSTSEGYLDIIDSSVESPLVCTDPQRIGSDGVYVDTRVKFTPAIDNKIELKKTDKLALWAVQETTGGLVKLVARAGYFIDMWGETESHLYDITPNGFDVTAWHRLTIKALKLGADVIGDNTYYGFVVFLDEQPLTYAGKASAGDFAYGVLENLDTNAAQYYSSSAERNSILPSLAPLAKDYDSFGSLSAAGIGALDDFSITTRAPTFAEHQLKFTLTWDAGVAELSVNNELVDLSAGTKKVIELDASPKELTIAAVIKEGFDTKWVNGTKSVRSGDVIAVTTSATLFSVDGVHYPDTDTGRREAVAAAMTSGTPLKLNADYANRQLYVEYPAGATASERTLTLDLCGHTFGPIEAGPTIYVAKGSSITIVDSVGGGKVLAGSRYGEALRTNGPVTIEAGHFEGDLVCSRGATAASIVFEGGTVKEQASDNRHFPYLTANGKDAFLNDGVWTIDTAREAIVRVPEVEHATYVVKVEGESAARAPDEYGEYRVAFWKGVTVEWTEETGYRIMNGTGTQTIAGEEITLLNTQPTVIKPTVELQPYEINYVYLDEEGAEVEFEGTNGNAKRYTIVEAVTIEPSLIADETYAVTGVSLEKIELGSTGSKEVIVTLAKKSGRSWSSLTSADEADGLSEQLSKVKVATLAKWADENEVPLESAPIVRPQAFLFACANTEEAIEAKTKEFYFTAEDLQTILAGEDLTTLNGVEHNGHLTVLGSTDLKNWHVKQPGDRFFKGRLTLTEDAE